MAARHPRFLNAAKTYTCPIVGSKAFSSWKIYNLQFKSSTKLASVADAKLQFPMLQTEISLFCR